MRHKDPLSRLTGRGLKDVYPHNRISSALAHRTAHARGRLRVESTPLRPAAGIRIPQAPRPRERATRPTTPRHAATPPRPQIAPLFMVSPGPNRRKQGVGRGNAETCVPPGRKIRPGGANVGLAWPPDGAYHANRRDWVAALPHCPSAGRSRRAERLARWVRRPAARSLP
jgi:hypothetical protein